MCILTIFARNPLACPSPRTLMYVGLIYYEPIYIKRRPKPATARGARDMDAKTLCLGVLSRGAASGYEIKKAFEEGPFSHFHQRSEEHTSELQSLMRISYAVFCLKKKTYQRKNISNKTITKTNIQ